MLPDADAEKTVEQLIKINSAVYSSAMAYANTINVAGYAAMFAIWSFTRSQLSPVTTLVVALLLLVSIGVFILFEVYKMVVSALDARAFGEVVKARLAREGLPALLKEYGQTTQLRTFWLMKVWPYVLVVTLATAYGAGLILIGSFVCTLLNQNPAG